MLGDKAWLAFHLMCWMGWGQGSVQASHVLADQTRKAISLWVYFVNRAIVILKQERVLAKMLLQS